MNKPKVLIHVVGGVAYWTSSGDVDVIVVDEDNIRAGDPPVQLTREWEALARSTFDLSDNRFISVGDSQRNNQG